MTAPLAFIDTETTGVHPGRRAWEVAIIRRDEDGVQTEWMAQVIDVDLSAADPFGLKVGRFYDRHPAYDGAQEMGLRQTGNYLYATEAEVAPVVERLTRGAHLVGAVPNFDTETLDPMLRRHRLVPAWHYHIQDVEGLAVGYLSARARHDPTLTDEQRAQFRDLAVPPWKSDDLSRAVGVEPASDEERHTALGDARWAMRLYDAVTAHDQPGTGHRP